MAKKKTAETSSNSESLHSVSYNEGDVKVTTTHATKAHADVLINRLKGHGVPYEYNGPAEEISGE